MRFLRSVLLGLGILLVAAISVAAVGAYMYGRQPTWYRRPHWTAAEQKAVANSADQKFADVFSWAAAIQAQRVRQLKGTPAQPDENPAATKTVTLTEDEVNSFVDNWHDPRHNGWKDKLSPYFSDGRIVLQKRRLILAGESKDLGAVVSISFQPKIDDQGRLDLELSDIDAGRLPLPQALVQGRLDRLEGLLSNHLVDYQQAARMDRTDAVNGSAVAAQMTKLLLNALNGRPSDAVLFVPFDLRDLKRELAVKLTGMTVEDGSMSLTLEPLSLQEQKALLSRIRQPPESPAGEQPS